MNRRPAALALLFVGLGAAGWIAKCQDDLDAPIDRPSPTPPDERPVIEPAMVAAPPPFAPVVDAPPPIVDAGLVAQADTTPPPGFDVEAYVRRWRAALAPLMRPGKPERKTVRVASAPEDRPDAGACTPGRSRGHASTKRRALDLVVFVDTSGSMWRVLPDAVRWLATVEQALRVQLADFQLIVVADRRSLMQRGKPASTFDAGVVQSAIGSHDMLNVVLSSGRDLESWRSLVRPSTQLELVLITDDSAEHPDPERALMQVLGSDATRARVHVLGGFQAPVGELVAPETPLLEAVCRPAGVSAGLVYQRLAVATGGWRTSLCDPLARAALAARLTEGTGEPTPPCTAWFDVPAGGRVWQVSVVLPSGLTEPLAPQPRLEGCVGLRRAYVGQGASIQLCAATCEALGDVATSLETRWDCR